MLLKATQAVPEIPIDLTPVIDMVFNLLIFFLVATTFHQTEREMKIALPAASTTAPISTLLRDFVVNVSAEGSIVVRGSTLSGDELRSKVREAVAVNPEQKVTVRGDRLTAYEHVVAVLDICKGAGVQEPFLDTVLAK